MTLTGAAYRLPEPVFDDVNTDVIIAGAYLRLPEDELADHAFEGAIPGFREELGEASILVAGSNFGCGSSREQAPKALLGCGVRVVLAESFGGIFFRNALNLGLAPLRVLDADRLRGMTTGTTLTVDLESGSVEVQGGRPLRAAALGPELMQIVRAGGILSLLSHDPHALG
jgi:3-isopropylmalate/(R)-2-methylmalate dehydratase small subunit